MANNNVHTGFWVDHSRGSVLGATITLESRYGGQLISAATVVVNIIGVALWSLLAFVLHQKFSHPGLRDEYEAQRQVLLRNASGAETAAWSLFKNGFVWRGRRRRVVLEATLTALVPASVYALFIVAGVFVGKIATASYDVTPVLVKSGACGYIQSTGERDSDLGSSHVSINVSSVARQYAQSCYTGGGTASAISCSVYPVPRLNYTIDLDPPCPFADEACFTDSNSRPMTLRTKPLNSHFDMGVNAPARDRLTLEYQATCAPFEYTFLQTYTDMVNITIGPGMNETATRLRLGRPWSDDDGALFNYFSLVRSLGLGVLPYSLNAFSSRAPHDDTDLNAWQAATPLASVSGDLDIIVISPNSIRFTGPVQDVMFQTNQEPVDIPDLSDAPYITTNAFYVMGCTETYQICNPVKSKCTGWQGGVEMNLLAETAAETLDLNEAQNATFQRLSQITGDANLFNALDSVPNSLLASSYLTSSTNSQPLPNGFWRSEVEGWFQSVLAKIQYLQTVFVNVPLDIVRANGIELVTADKISPALAQQCTQQRVSAPAQYTNYNFFALIFIFILGILIPATAISLKTFYQHLPWVNHRGSSYLSYEAEGLMQLHRMALEGAGYGGWKYERKDEIPRTEVARRRLPQVELVTEGEGEGGYETIRYPKKGETRDYGDESASGSGSGKERGYEEVAKSDPDR